MSTSKKWEREKKAVRAVQLAFDVGEEVNRQIRLEALERNLNPPDRVREILGLPVNGKPVRPRLSISLSEEDFEQLAVQFDTDPADRLKIRQIAAEKLIGYISTDKDS